MLRRYPQLSLADTGGGHLTLLHGSQPLRYPDGRKMVVPCSPKNGGDAAKLLMQNLEAAGLRPR